ncbi:hypothetical protein [Formosa algae]|uniref:Outer membrane protein beta-barrel domain-containing protein n=1 Tax=Formosa algae TaxID=225843 RepID=A0A9X0YL95_9FLAO|nr:hypothetical protein [Formosa algae]MBP1841125.1 hypothetical protein [Formosa algae]MDQ0336455.1 hypothetical protein [Formosa algae]OEI81416.1 hypothetical protein AST99_04050 [Formosa algae]PNW27950.1 hypothetical protein BKP44_11075 [Formosa algae]
MKRGIVTTIILLLFVCKSFAQPSVYENPEFNFDRWKSSTITAVFTGVNVQEGLNIGASAALPLNSASNIISTGVLLDVNFLYQAQRTIGIGLASGYGIYFGKDNEGSWGPINNKKDFRYIPVAAATRVALYNGIIIGTDLGYAFGLSENWDGGFYFRPMLGYNINEALQLNLSYSGISNNWTWSAASLGFTINLGN